MFVQTESNSVEYVGQDEEEVDEDHQPKRELQVHYLLVVELGLVAVLERRGFLLLVDQAVAKNKCASVLQRGHETVVGDQMVRLVVDSSDVNGCSPIVRVRDAH